MRLSAAIVQALLGLIVATAARGAEPVRVDIAKFAFSPKELTVPIGTTILWTNRDETPHTVSADDKSFVSPALDTGDAYERTFEREGDVPYFCTVHPFMTGVVHVRKQ